MERAVTSKLQEIQNNLDRCLQEKKTVAEVLYFYSLVLPFVE